MRLLSSTLVNFYLLTLLSLLLKHFDNEQILLANKIIWTKIC